MGEHRSEASTEAPVSSRVETEPIAAPTIRLSAESVAATVAKGTTVNIDKVMTASKILRGGMLMCKDAVWGDKLTFQVVDLDDVVVPAGTGETVLSEFITDWFVDSEGGTPMQIHTEQGTTIPTGVYIRCKYKSVGVTNDVGVHINYDLSVPI